MINFKRHRTREAFSLIELMFSLVMLIIILVGLMYTYVVCFKLNNSSRDMTLINSALQAKLESVMDTPFDSLSSLDGNTFTLSGFAADVAVGFIDVYDSVYNDLKYVRIVACWEEGGKGTRRKIGEDINLDGILESSEDLDNDGMVDSPAEIVTLISRI